MAEDTFTLPPSPSNLHFHLSSPPLTIFKRQELVLKIAILAERFRSEHEWYVDVILSCVLSSRAQPSYGCPTQPDVLAWRPSHIRPHYG